MFPVPRYDLLRAAAAFVAIATLSACGGGGAASQPPAITITSGPIAYAVEAHIPVGTSSPIERVTFTIQTRPGGTAKDARVTYARSWLDREGAIDPVTGDVTVPVFGLYADHDNEVAIDVALASGAHERSTLVIRGGPPPSGPLPTLAVGRKDPALDVQYLLLAGHETPTIVDIDGEIRWRGPDIGRLVLPRAQVPQGMVVGSLRDNTLYHMDWLGNLATTAMDDPRCVLSHHTLEPGKVGWLNTVGWQDGELARPLSVLAEMTITGEVLKIWDFDELFRAHILAHGEDPTLLVPDDLNWFHMNYAIYDPSDDSIVASSRENFVVKVDYETGAIRWLLGNPAKLWYTAYPLSLQPLALSVQGLPPIGQHSPAMSADGTRLTLFDNGLGNLGLPSVGDSRSYSRAVTYAIDPVARTAVETWSYAFGQAVYSPYCSSAAWTPSGNMLIVCSTPSDGSPARFEVVAPTQQVLFDATVAQGQCGVVFRADAFALEDLVLE